MRVYAVGTENAARRAAGAMARLRARALSVAQPHSVQEPVAIT